MRVVVAIDSFKGSMTSMEAGRACAEGIVRAAGDRAQVLVKPLADGGEGTVDALAEGLGGDYQYVTVTGPAGEPVTARYAILEGGRAVMEMAEASGITRMKGRLDPWKASSFGVGEMILDAVEKGCRELIIGIGGSATTEGGIGMLSALGYEFTDQAGKKLPPVFSALSRVAGVSAEHVSEKLQACHFQIACDVNSPLCGKKGSIYVFGAQKGVREEEMEEMDRAMRSYAACLERQSGKHFQEQPGAGAAGGLGFAFLWGLPHVELKPGIEIVVEAVDLLEACKDADVVVTGEGQLDAQTAMGKVPVGVAKAAKACGCKVIALAGSVTEDAGACNRAGIDAFFSILPGVCTLEEAMDREQAQKNMRRTAEQVFRLLMEEETKKL